MKKEKFRPTAEQIEELRNQWKTRHPEEFARREAKRNPVSLEREEDENIEDIIPVVLTDSEKGCNEKGNDGIVELYLQSSSRVPYSP